VYRNSCMFPLLQSEFIPILTKLLHTHIPFQFPQKWCSCVSGPSTQVDQCM